MASLTLLRDADWLNDARARRVRNVLLILTPLIALGWIALSRGGISPSGQPLGTDYLSFWTAARFAIGGAPALAYDAAAHYAAQHMQAGIDPGYSAFYYPPPFLLVLLPFGLVGYFPSLIAWLGATGYAYWRVARAWAAGWAGALPAFLAFPALLANAGHGQNGFLTAALLGGGALLVGRRPWLAGALLGTLVVKPHLALIVPVALLLRGEWRTFVAAGLSAAALLLLSAAMLGTESWHGFLAVAPVAHATLEQGLVGPEKMQSLFAGVRMLGGSLPLAYGVQAVGLGLAVAGLALVARARADARAQGAAMVAAAMLATPFLLDYDLTLAIIPLLWVFTEGRAKGFLPWEKLVLGAAFLLPLVSRGIAGVTGVPLAPLVLGALFLVVLRRARSDHRHAAIDVQRLPGDVAGLAAG